MPTGENVLWIVEKRNAFGGVAHRYVFRTQIAAYEFAAAKENLLSFNQYVVHRAEWGPDNTKVPE